MEGADRILINRRKESQNEAVLNMERREVSLGRSRLTQRQEMFLGLQQQQQQQQQSCKCFSSHLTISFKFCDMLSLILKYESAAQFCENSRLISKPDRYVRIHMTHRN